MKLASVGNMIQFTKLFLVTTTVVQSGDYHLRTVVRRHDGINETYVVDDAGYTFNETVKWCAHLGGRLPMPRDAESLNFLVEKALMKYTSGYSEWAWMGRKSSYMSMCSNQWLDGHPVDMIFRSYSSSYNCDTCHGKSCCAMFVITSSSYLNRTGFLSCSHLNKRVLNGHFRFEELVSVLHHNRDTSHQNNHMNSYCSYHNWTVFNHRPSSDLDSTLLQEIGASYSSSGHCYL